MAGKPRAKSLMLVYKLIADSCFAGGFFDERVS